ncbi:MAG: peptide ABC transporter substrate-binding protein [Candidatus Spechtbacterales bacterium]
MDSQKGKVQKLFKQIAENELLQKIYSTSVFIKIRDSIKSLVLFSKRIFQRFNPRERYFASLGLFIIVGSLLVLGVGFYLNRTQALPTQGGEYREALVGQPRFINPILAVNNDVDRDLTRLVYSSLMRYDVEGNLIPDLASEYEISEDGREYRFTLKEGIEWEDGNPITSEDVAFTINLIQNPQYSSPLFQSWQGVDVSAEDERTVVFTLSSAYPPFIENATVGILPMHVWRETTPRNFALTDLNLQPIGSGPFTVEKFTKDSSGLISSYTLERNDNYHGQNPFLDAVTFKFYPSEDDAIRAYNNRSVDGIASISPLNIEKIRSYDSLELHEFTMPRYFAIFMNLERSGVLEDVNMRRALVHATDVDRLIDNALSGYGRAANTAIPPSLSEYYNEELPASNYDPEKANELLTEMGWNVRDKSGILIKEGDNEEEISERLSFSLITVRRPELELVAESLKEQWQESGIELDIALEDLGELQQTSIRPRSYQLLMFGHILGSMPDPFSFWHSSQKNDPGLNLSGYDNSSVDSLLERARTETDEGVRIELYKEFQETIFNDVPAIFLYDPAYLYPVHRNIQGISPAVIVDSSFRFVDIENWYIKTRRVF